MNVIYQPKGRALEYSELACNLYLGCSHGCKYCYAPACMRTTHDKWKNNIVPRKNVISLFARDAAKMFDNQDTRPILFSFLSDPYQRLEEQHHLTREALQIVYHHKLKSKILTKGMVDLIDADLQLMRLAGTELGVTLCFTDDVQRQEWEPHASSVDERIAIIKKAHSMEIKTWVSLEPVIDPEQALDVIRQLYPWVNLWKIGKLNHFKEIEEKVDWRKFRIQAEEFLIASNANYYFKESLKIF